MFNIPESLVILTFIFDARCENVICSFIDYTMCRFDWSVRSKESSYCVKCALINASSVNGEVTLQITGQWS